MNVTAAQLYWLQHSRPPRMMVYDWHRPENQGRWFALARVLQLQGYQWELSPVTYSFSSHGVSR